MHAKKVKLSIRISVFCFNFYRYSFRIVVTLFGFDVLVFRPKKIFATSISFSLARNDVVFVLFYFSFLLKAYIFETLKLAFCLQFLVYTFLSL